MPLSNMDAHSYTLVLVHYTALLHIPVVVVWESYIFTRESYNSIVRLPV